MVFAFTLHSLPMKDPGRERIWFATKDVEIKGLHLGCARKSGQEYRPSFFFL